MTTVSPHNLVMLMLALIFFLGLAFSVTGLLVLVLKAFSPDMKALTAQTTKLVQKGVAEDVAGLVGNASSLLEAMNQMTRTAAGVGVFLTLLGLLLMGFSSIVAARIYLSQL